MKLRTPRPNRHRIQRQIVELAIGASGDAPVVHRELARPFWDRAVPDLEQVFDSVAGPDQLLRLERLEIDLGSVDGVDWTTEFRRKLIAELTRNLAELAIASNAPDGNACTDPLPEPWQQFLFFLIHGRLPWWGAKPGDGWSDALLDSPDAAGWSALREAVMSDPHARARLVYSVGDDFLDTAVAKWSGLRHAARVLERWTPKGLRAEAGRQWRREFWSVVIDWVSAGGFRSPHRGPELVRDLLTLRLMYVSDSEPGARPSSRSPAGSDQGGPIRTAPSGDLPEPWHEWHRLQGDDRFLRGVTDTPTDGAPTTERAPALSPWRQRAPSNQVVRRPAEDEAIYVDGAGVVLLHPFLEQLFRERGLWAERSFRDAEARGRAVHLIGLLTFGRLDVPEYELVLAKLLCGVPFEEPLEPAELGNDDLVACDQVLRAVLEHWTALRSSSPEWLRQHFFLREGKLERVDSGYLLTIERHAQDVLLTRLPWGCGVVALPWLAERMFVRWLD